MTGMKPYYVSRALVSAAFGALFVLAGSAAWIGALVGGLAFGWFLLAPHIGRYAVRPESGATALRHDERGEVIRDAAARNAFVLCALALAAVIVYARIQSLSSIPVAMLQWLLVLGALVYYASEFWLRRT